MKTDFKNLKLGLKKQAALSKKGRARKVRVLVFSGGEVKVEGKDISVKKPADNRVAISKVKTDSSNILLYHKTTKRELYDSEYGKWSGKGYYDVLFTNEKGELTEAHSSNIVVKIGRKYFTPPVKSGLLAGTYRGYLMEKPEIMLKEETLFPSDLKKADAVFLCNSVRGLRQVRVG